MSEKFVSITTDEGNRIIGLTSFGRLFRGTVQGSRGAAAVVWEALDPPESVGVEEALDESAPGILKAVAEDLAMPMSVTEVEMRTRVRHAIERLGSYSSE